MHPNDNMALSPSHLLSSPNTPTVWLSEPRFSVNLLERDHAKPSAPFPINDAVLGSKVVNDYQDACFISQVEAYTASVSHSRIDNNSIL